MIDRVLFFVYEYVMAYHSLRGSNCTVWQSLKSSFMVYARRDNDVDIDDFQKNMWKAMKEISAEHNKDI